MFKTGVVTEVSTAKCAARVQFPDNDGVVSFWLPILQHKSLKDKHYFVPDVNEHVACLLDDNGEAGVILGAIYSEADAPPVDSADKHHVTFADGTVLEYDRSLHKLTADVKGDIDVKATGKCIAAITGDTIITTPNCTLNGNLKVNGNITASGEVADANGAKTMSGMRIVFDSHTHPENGTGGGTTSAPKQRMQ